MPVRRQLFAFDKLIPKSARRIPRRLRCRASTKNLATGIADFGFVCARPQLDLFKQGSVSAPRSDLSTHCEVSTSAPRESCPAEPPSLLRAEVHQSHAERCSSPQSGRKTKQNSVRRNPVGWAGLLPHTEFGRSKRANFARAALSRTRWFAPSTLSLTSCSPT